LVVGILIKETVVQTIGPALPKFDRAGVQVIPSPVAWPGWVFPVLFFGFEKGFLKGFSAIKWMALLGCPSPNPA